MCVNGEETGKVGGSGFLWTRTQSEQEAMSVKQTDWEAEWGKLTAMLDAS